MDVERLLFSLSVCVFSFLVLVSGRGDDQRSSSITAPHLLLPMFHHQPIPAVSKELLSPVTGSSQLPRPLSEILIPQRHESPTRVSPVSNNHGVEVWCGYSRITVTINQDRLNFRSSAAHFRLGTCPASRVDGRVVYFHYDLNECGSLLSVVKGQLLYANEVLYRPERQGAVLRAMPLKLAVQCVYDRFHYSYKIGYFPEFRPQSYRKTMVKKQLFSVSVRDANWQELGVNESFILGEPVYFEVATETISKDKSVYVEACHVTDSNSTQRYDVISNFGCMVDSKRTGSRSRYVSRQMNVLRFSLDAFSFAEAASERFYLHCTVLVGNVTASATAKSCTYSESEHRWAELKGHASVCTCCDSECRPSGFNSWSSVQQAVVSSKPWSLIHDKVFTEASEKPNTAPGSILLHHLHQREGESEREGQGVLEHEEEGVVSEYEWEEESYYEGEGSDEDWEESDYEGEESDEEGEEELCVGEQLEEEVVMGIGVSVEDDEMMNDEGIEEDDTVKNKEKDKDSDADEVQKEETSMQKNLTNFTVKFSEGIWEDEEMLKRNMSENVSAAETSERRFLSQTIFSDPVRKIRV
ncbi:zona pellucida glycoprotein 3d tandem duplicate 1 [Tachysurus fulvidraco]|uniref:zona pellucida glycoprotein 3d tandem duplicate 1 n=1 Tax=Tachysurus fulvidraco TaxID=1234273 RepID=UPI001FEE1AD4|nr:zona pellucida glycoprotein 3d tandem duplicate 1 [Tachysurus fulvidraco]